MTTADDNHKCEPRAVAIFTCRRCRREVQREMSPMEHRNGPLVGTVYRLPEAPNGWVAMHIGYVTGLVCGECERKVEAVAVNRPGATS